MKNTQTYEVLSEASPLMHRLSKAGVYSREAHLGLKLQDSSCPWQLESGWSSRPRVHKQDVTLFLDAILVRVAMDDDVRRAA